MQYKLLLTPKNVIAFLALLFVCHELHELVHTSVAYSQCGCWGQRDFNAWQVCSTCPSTVNTIWATLAGPLLTYVLIWIGWWLMGKRRTRAQQSVGFALLWTNVPFARFFTVLMKAGDESVVTKAMVGQSTLPMGIWLIETFVILVLVLPPFIRSWKLLAARRRVWIFIAFLIGPMLIEFISMHQLGNRLLANGVLSKPGILGSPILINVWNWTWLVLFLLSFANLATLFQTSKKYQVERQIEVQNF